jgi:L-arabinose isomerase
VALRALLEHADSRACGLNFLELCNDEHVADGLHVAASMLMSEGLGYAGEGDWVTAVLVRGMQEGFGIASFSEVFSIGYDDNRLLLKHWGEGNFAMARAKPRLLASKFTDRQTAEFAIVDFEFEPGPAMLVNLNSTAEGRGQLVSIRGRIDEDPLPQIDGPRAVFKPDRDNVSDLLTDYAYAGGSHHLALVKGAPVDVLEKVCRLAGWVYRSQ